MAGGVTPNPAKIRQGYVLIYGAGSHPTPAEIAAYDGHLAKRFRNGKFFQAADCELQTNNDGQFPSAVYTNNPEIRETYERLAGEIVPGYGRIPKIPVHPIAVPVSAVNALPTQADLEKLTVPELVERFGVEGTKPGRNKAAIIREILES